MDEKDTEMEEFLNSILNEPLFPPDGEPPLTESNDEEAERDVSDKSDITEDTETSEDTDGEASDADVPSPEGEADEAENSDAEAPDGEGSENSDGGYAEDGEYVGEEDEYGEEEYDEEYDGEEYDENDLRRNFGRFAEGEDIDEEIKQSRKKRRKKKKARTGRLIFALVLTTFIVCVSIFIAVFILKTVKSVTGLDRPDYQVVVDIPENSTTDDIAAILLENKIIDDADLFAFMAKLRGVDGSFTAGSHIMSPNMSYSDVMTELQKYYEKERETVDVTFTEGITICEAAKLLEENGVCEAERFIYIFNSSSFGFDFEAQVETSSDKFMKMEGFLFPDTYTFYVDDEPEVVAKKIYKNFENKITPNLYGRMMDLGISLEDTITLASIVQEEASDPKDMQKIASVFWNRMHSPRFPKLESDPTRKYVEDTIKPNIEVPDEKMFTLYNTYEAKGLPPGAIGNPGLDAVNAVLYPAETNYYFFCANVNTGETFYAETLEEHEQNLARAHISSQRN